jgi:formylglycine-generating enzyme required for sulfatase activity/tRNA A-37 threonylcarbamoyl transferase component Bud32
LRQAAAADARFAVWPTTKYRVERILGAGAFGIAFLCHDTYLDRRVVIKTFEAASIDRDVAAIFREARILDSLNNAGIIHLYSCGFVDEIRRQRPYLEIAHFSDSLTLEDHVHQHGELSLDDLLPVAVQTARALEAAHQAGVWHRDVKPGNLLVRNTARGWEVKIIDFGLSLRRSLVQTSQGRAAGLGPSMVGSAVAGTLHYAAPEQLDPNRSGEIGPHSDVFGFGRTCYFALFREPYPDQEDLEALPRPWKDFLGRCVARKIERRPKDFAAVLAGLGAIQEQSPETVTTPPVGAPASSPAATLAAAAPVRPATPPKTAEARKDAHAASWEGSKAGDLKVGRVNDQDLRLRWCPPGSFKMGSPKNEQGRRSNEDQVDVTLSRGFWMQETQVTQGLWQAVMGTKLDWSSNGQAPNLPVYNVNHGEAEAFGAKLTELLRQGKQLPSGLKLILPTEAQWEYAARAGTTSRFPFGDDEGKLGDYAWYSVNSGGKPHEVKSREPNPWGLHDMLGNVWEWCADGYADKLTGGVDPWGPSDASYRAFRGGSWFIEPALCRPAYRDWFPPENRNDNLGFRVAAVQEKGQVAGSV